MEMAVMLAAMAAAAACGRGVGGGMVADSRSARGAQLRVEPPGGGSDGKFVCWGREVEGE